jgi:hypothetical protein
LTSDIGNVTKIKKQGGSMQRVTIQIQRALGRNDTVYDIEASADVSCWNEVGTEIDNFELYILREGKMLTGKRYDAVVSHIDTDEIDELLIEQYEG